VKQLKDHLKSSCRLQKLVCRVCQTQLLRKDSFNHNCIYALSAENVRLKAEISQLKSSSEKQAKKLLELERYKTQADFGAQH